LGTGLEGSPRMSASSRTASRSFGCKRLLEPNTGV
jgi:hypothetical protein